MSQLQTTVVPEKSRSLESGWTHWRDYFRDRFPLSLYAVLIASFYLVNHAVAQAFAHPNRSIHLDPRVFAGWLVMLCLFFQLRVFDDDKDYLDDCQHFPERVLQLGSVTRRQLFGLAGVAFLVEIIFSAMVGLPALTAAAIASGWTLLMWREFFARDWLRRHFLVSALLHLLVMPLLALAVFSFSTDQYPWEAPLGFLAFSVLGYLLAFTAEIARKVRAPEDERFGVNTYTRVLGISRTVFLLGGLTLIEALLAGSLGLVLGLSSSFFLVLGQLVTLFLTAVLVFRIRQNRGAARGVQTCSAVFLLGFDLNWLVALGLQLGINGQ